MLNYQEFKDVVRGHILEYIPNEQDSVVSVDPVTKNNAITRDGITVRSPEERISPVIYLDDFYEEYKMGLSVENCMRRIAVTIDQAKSHADVFDTDSLMDYDQMKQKLYISVVNFDKNQELLQSVPHEKKGDLAVVIRALVNEGQDEMASFVINNNILQQYGISNEQLFADAYSNTPSLMPYFFKSMQDIFEEKMPEMDMESMMQDVPPMYVLSSRSKIGGASAMFYPGVMDKIYEDIGEMIIIPSSVNEVLIMPAEDISEKELEAMICEVNDTHLEDVEVLASKPLTYDHISKQILNLEEQRKYLLEIKKDIAESGFKATDKLVAGMRRINHMTGEFQGISGLHKLSKDIGRLENQELKDAVNAAAAECREQQMARQAAMRPPELGL